MELNTSHLLTTAMKGLDYTHRQAQLHYNRWAISKKRSRFSSGTLSRRQDHLRSGPAITTPSCSGPNRLLPSVGLLLPKQLPMFITEKKVRYLITTTFIFLKVQWPDKAYDDAMERARQRDAGRYMDYGFTRPGVISSGVASEEDVNLDPQPQIADPDVQKKRLAASASRSSVGARIRSR